MRKEIIVCDDCGKEIANLYESIKITISDVEYHFCFSECAIPFLINEARKENPTNLRPDIEFGKEN